MTVGYATRCLCYGATKVSKADAREHSGATETMLYVIDHIYLFNVEFNCIVLEGLDKRVAGSVGRGEFPQQTTCNAVRVALVNHK